MRRWTGRTADDRRGRRDATPVDACRTVIAAPAADGAHAVRGILTFLKQVGDHPKAWCGKDAATADDRRLYMRAFVHRIYDYRCSTGAP